MEIDISKQIEEAKRAATDVLVHNAHGPFQGLPRTAGWGYPEPYTRDLMIAALGIAVTGNSELMKSLRRVLEKLAKNQSEHGHIPSLVHKKLFDSPDFQTGKEHEGDHQVFPLF